MQKVILTALLLSNINLIYSMPNQVVIIRHGEKPKQGHNLSCKGFNRALKLPEALSPRFGYFNQIYVPSITAKDDKSYSARMFELATPYAVKYQVPINSRYGITNIQQVATNILAQNGNILVVWEHKQIPNLAKALGIGNPPLWQNKDFDSVWIITNLNKSATIQYAKENIYPSNICQFK